MNRSDENQLRIARDMVDEAKTILDNSDDDTDLRMALWRLVDAAGSLAEITGMSTPLRSGQTDFELRKKRVEKK